MKVRASNINWPKQPAQISVETVSLQMEMQNYGKTKSKSVKSARAFLRSVGLEISAHGAIVNGKTV